MPTSSHVFNPLGPIAGLLGLGLLAKVIADSRDQAERMRQASERRSEHARRAVLTAAGRIQRVAALDSLPLFVERRGIRNAWVLGEVVHYDPDWIIGLLQSHCDDQACNRSVVVGLIAHELGHWVHRDSYNRRLDPWDVEFRADAWAAHVLAALGIPAAHFREVLAAIAPNHSPSHPSGPLRAERMQREYLRALGYREVAFG